MRAKHSSQQTIPGQGNDNLYKLHADTIIIYNENAGSLLGQENQQLSCRFL
jgi:hypothetical protein